MKKYFVATLSGLAVILLVPWVAQANAVLLNPLCLPGGDACITTVAQLIFRVTGYIFTIIGITAVLMFVVSGIYFVVSAGQESKVAHARKIAIAAAVGAAIALAGTGLVGLIGEVIGKAPT